MNKVKTAVTSKGIIGGVASFGMFAIVLLQALEQEMPNINEIIVAAGGLVSSALAVFGRIKATTEIVWKK